MAALAVLKVAGCRLTRRNVAPVRILSGFLHGVPGSEFRSVYSLDKLYPNSQDGGHTEGETEQRNTDIPLDRLTISYSRSSGPGGQHVNKVNTKAEVRFQLGTADWIAEDVRQKIAMMHKNKINKSGELFVRSEVSRYQMRNLAECLQKIRDIIADASQKPKLTKKEDAELRRIRVESMNHERLRQKRIHSVTKQSRRVDVE